MNSIAFKFTVVTVGTHNAQSRDLRLRQPNRSFVCRTGKAECVMDERALLYFDDLREGQTFVTDTHTVTEAEILRFARDFDPQPFHLDHNAASRTLFKGLSGSGWHTAALTMRLMVTSGPRLAAGILGIGGELEWITPMRPNDTLQVHSEILQLTPSRSRPERGVATIRNETKNQRGEVVQRFTARVIVPVRGLSEP